MGQTLAKNFSYLPRESATIKACAFQLERKHETVKDQTTRPLLSIGRVMGRWLSCMMIDHTVCCGILSLASMENRVGYNMSMVSECKATMSVAIGVLVNHRPIHSQERVASYPCCPGAERR